MPVCLLRDELLSVSVVQWPSCPLLPLFCLLVLAALLRWLDSADANYAECTCAPCRFPDTGNTQLDAAFDQLVASPPPSRAPASAAQPADAAGRGRSKEGLSSCAPKAGVATRAAAGGSPQSRGRKRAAATPPASPSPAKRRLQLSVSEGRPKRAAAKAALQGGSLAHQRAPCAARQPARCAHDE